MKKTKEGIKRAILHYLEVNPERISTLKDIIVDALDIDETTFNNSIKEYKQQINSGILEKYSLEGSVGMSKPISLSEPSKDPRKKYYSYDSTCTGGSIIGRC